MVLVDLVHDKYLKHSALPCKMRIGDLHCLGLPVQWSMVNVMEISEGGVSRDLVELSRQNVQLGISSTEMLACGIHLPPHPIPCNGF